MTKWAHKVRAYFGVNHYSENGYPVKEHNSEGFVITLNGCETMSIEEWLDWQCEGGWELFKYHPNGWCVFRKQI